MGRKFAYFAETRYFGVEMSLIKKRILVHSKNTRVKLDPERVHWGQTPFWIKDDPEIGQLSADLTNNGVRLTDFRVIVDLEWSMDPFWVKFDPGVIIHGSYLKISSGKPAYIPLFRDEYPRPPPPPPLFLIFFYIFYFRA